MDSRSYSQEGMLSFPASQYQGTHEQCLTAAAETCPLSTDSSGTRYTLYISNVAKPIYVYLKY